VFPVRSLATKRRVEYVELATRRFITRCSSDRMPFEWTINPYRGCEFGCKYCYARYTHEFLEIRDPVAFERQIFVKLFHAPAFRQELSKTPRLEHIAIGTATDPYQPAERRYRVTGRILKILAGESGRRLSITTKSDLITRDLELLATIARRNVLSIHMTITTLDVELARALEPMAPRPDLRMDAVRQLSSRGVQVGVFASPLLPLINDSAESLEAVAAAAKQAGAHHFGGGVLFLKPCAKEVFLPFLEEQFPHLLRRYRERFDKSAFLRGPYVDGAKQRVAAARQKHGLLRGPVPYEPAEWEGEPQLSLFAIQST
jgi:DNA repair photolyase